MELTAEIVAGFAGSLLSPRYDDPQPTPDFHLELWNLCCGENRQVAAAAPRGHAKSTAVTHAYVLACALFKVTSNIMILSDTEDQAKQFLGDIKVELEENQELRELFHVNCFIKDNEKELIVSIGEDRHLFRIFAKATGQSLRGSKWRNKRPDLIIGDDMENDEMVSNPERRAKLKKWLLAVLIPALARKGKIRVVGTILHSDSLLEYLLNSKNWKSARFEAHNDDFSSILWPEAFPKTRLLDIRALFEEAGELDLYAQEYRNQPIDEATSLIKKSDLLEMKPDVDEYLEYYIGVDLAISLKTKADYTVFFVIGVNKEGKIKVVDIIRGRFDTNDIINQVFELQQVYKPQFFVFEDENINKAIGPVLYTEMNKRKIYPLIETERPSKDKIVRARPMLGLLRAKQIEFDKTAPWYPALEMELLQFPRGKKDDQVDAGGIVCLKLRQLHEADEDLTKTTEDYDDSEYDNYEDPWEEAGICRSTGY